MKPVNRKRSFIVVAVALVIAVSAAFAAYKFRSSSPPAGLFLAGTGISGGALMILAGRLPRFVVSGVLMATTGIILAFSGISLEPGFAILYGAIGLLLFVSGTVVFLLFMRNSVEPAQ